MDPVRQLIPRRQIEELGERCRIYDHALRLIIVKTPHSLAAQIARQTLGGVDTYRIHKTIAARVTTAW